MDFVLSFSHQVKAVTKSALYHLKNIKTIKTSLEKHIHAFHSRRIDYCNDFFTGLFKKTC